jgi:ribonuclease HI
MIEIYFDGACEPINPGGTASYGYLVKQDGKTIIQGSKIIGTGKGMTNNVAEYTGLIEAVKAISNLNKREKLRICGDSNIVCNTIAKKWGWNKKKTLWNPHKNAPHLKPLLEEALNLLKSFDYEIKWISSKDNQQADWLSKEPLIKAGIIKTQFQGVSCPKCSGYLIERTGPFSRFFGCSNYPKCRFTRKISEEKRLKN